MDMLDVKFQAGARVAIRPDAPFARDYYTGARNAGVIEDVVSDTLPDPLRGPLYHVRLDNPRAGHWGCGYARNYADELTPEDGPADCEAAS